MTSLHKFSAKSGPSNRGSAHHNNISDLFASLASTTKGSDLLSSVFFYNIVLLEAMRIPLQKSSFPHAADCELIACQSLGFLSLTLDLFAEPLLQHRGRESRRILELLGGTYLAQMIQACLQFSQHK